MTSSSFLRTKNNSLRFISTIILTKKIYSLTILVSIISLAHQFPKLLKTNRSNWTLMSISHFFDIIANYSTAHPAKLGPLLTSKMHYHVSLNWVE